jgi:uracil-DNA glycosylase family protein
MAADRQPPLTGLDPTEGAEGGAAEFLPQARSLRALRTAARRCRGCGLWECATQTVFGQGRTGAELMLVGEQPGDREDVEGVPFVGPAGGLLDRALTAAEIDREVAYVTNAVKHFKWKPRGKRRLHQTPRAGEIEACKPWLLAELEAVEPRAVVAMGATAARALFDCARRASAKKPSIPSFTISSPLRRSCADARRLPELRYRSSSTHRPAESTPRPAARALRARGR